MEIERYIPEGREHAISRKELRALLGRDDRVIREWIKQANHRLEAEGKVILSSSSWRGYWISSDPEEIAAYLQEQGSRARTQARNDEPARRLLARLRGEKIIRVRSYIRRAKAESTLDGQEKWEV